LGKFKKVLKEIFLCERGREMAKYTRVLSIDGGGIRGIIPGQILVSLEKKLKEGTGNDTARIAEYFELIAGTSTGGILTCIYLCPDLENNPPRPRFSAEQAVDLYLDRGDEIFDVSLWQKIKSGGGLLDEKYTADELEEAFEDYFGDLKLSDLLKPCLITAYDIRRRKATFFTSHDAVKKAMNDYHIKEVARATSAAPTYFELARVKSLTLVPYPLIDGGVFANNPALCAYAEARSKLKGNPTARNMVVLSLGTGYAKKQYSYKEAKDWGGAEWIKPLIDILMSGVSETVNFQLGQIFDSVKKPKQYLRINDELLFAGPDMDDASTENLSHLRQEGTRIAEEFDDELDAFVDLLLKE
jgi:patatin-like phospholipase/acyl hydrolase